LRELFNSLAYSRAAGPNETRMSRRRRTPRALSSPISASDIGLTSDWPMLVHIFFAISNSASVAFCRNSDRCRTIGPSTSFVTPAAADAVNGELASLAIATTASSNLDASGRSPTSTS